MSDKLPSDVICPGQRKLMDPDGNHFLRAVCMVFWDGNPPSAQPFYLHQHRFELTLTGISTFEEEVLSVLKDQYYDHTPLSVTYLGYEGITMSDDEMAKVDDWRFLKN